MIPKLWNPIVTYIAQTQQIKRWDWETSLFFENYILIYNLIVTTCLKNGIKSCELLKENCWWNISQLRRLTGNTLLIWKRASQWVCLSEVMGISSTLTTTTILRKITKELGISSSTEILKGIWRSLYAKDKAKDQCGCDILALRWHCIENRYDAVVTISACCTS